MNFNSVTLVGRLAADPEYTKGNKPDSSDDRAWARLAINRPTNEGKADFVPICAWGPRARVLAQYGRKGKVLLVRGSLRTNNKLRPDGSYDNYTEVSVAEITLGPNPKSKVGEVEAPTPEPMATTGRSSTELPSLTPEMATFFQSLMGQAKVATQQSDNPFPVVG